MARSLPLWSAKKSRRPRVQSKARRLAGCRAASGCSGVHGTIQQVESIRGLGFISWRVRRPKLKSFSMFRKVASAHHAEETQ